MVEIHSKHVEVDGVSTHYLEAGDSGAGAALMPNASTRTFQPSSAASMAMSERTRRRAAVEAMKAVRHRSSTPEGKTRRVARTVIRDGL